MNALRNAAFLAAAALTVSILPSQAFTAAGVASSSVLAVADRLPSAAVCAAADAYFDFDALLTLSTLVAAGAVLAAAFSVARKRSAGEEAWREPVMRALQADLARYLESQRRAA